MGVSENRGPQHSCLAEVCDIFARGGRGLLPCETLGCPPIFGCRSGGSWRGLGDAQPGSGNTLGPAGRANAATTAGGFAELLAVASEVPFMQPVPPPRPKLRLKAISGTGRVSGRCPTCASAGFQHELRFLEEATSVPGAHARALLVILRMEQLLRSPFVDPRGEELLVLLLRHLCSDDTGLRAVFHCCDGETAYSALSADLVPSVASAELKEADASTTVLVLEDEAFPAEEDDKLPERRRWQMDQVLSHPAVLNLRTKHAEHDARQAHQSFDVVGSETVG
eukprot:s4013_g1.t1